VTLWNGAPLGHSNHRPITDEPEVAIYWPSALRARSQASGLERQPDSGRAVRIAVPGKQALAAY